MFKSLLKRDNTKYTVKDIVVWMVRAWRGNHLQAILNATLGLVEVAISLCQVWAVKYAIDIASHNKEGSIYIAVGLMTLLIIGSFAVSISETWVQNILGVRAQKPYAAADARPNTAFGVAQQGKDAQWRHDKPTGKRRQQCCQLPDDYHS